MIKSKEERRLAFLASKAKGIEGRRCRIEQDIAVRNEHGFVDHWETHAAKPGDSVSYSEIHDDSDGEWIELTYLTSGDYTGSLVEEANRKVWLEDLDPEQRATIEFRCSFGTQGICVYLPNLTPDQTEALRKLADYPLFDDEAHSNLECEREWEDWESSGRVDWRRALEREYEVDLDGVSDADVDALWWSNEKITDRRGDLWFSEGISTCFRVENAARLVSREDLLAFPACVNEDPEVFFAENGAKA